MSQKKQLSKEMRFIYQVFQAAAAMSQARFRDGKKISGGEVMPKNGDTNFILAGGAVRDLYFNRPARDVDLYYNTDVIDPASFANCLSRIDVNEMARAAGFETATIRRNSDGSLIGKQPVDPEGEDWGDVSEDARITIRSWASYYCRSLAGGSSSSYAIQFAHQHVPDANRLLLDRKNHDYAEYLVTNGLANSGGSAGGGKASSTHPLKSVEEFRVVINDWTYIDVELMGVAANPVEYMMTHFAVKLSRAYYDGAGVHYTSDFMQDARNQTITVACPVEHAKFDRLFSYYLPKMKKYFPAFEVRVDLDAMNGRNW